MLYASRPGPLSPKRVMAGLEDHFAPEPRESYTLESGELCTNWDGRKMLLSFTGPIQDPTELVYLGIQDTEIIEQIVRNCDPSANRYVIASVTDGYDKQRVVSKLCVFEIGVFRPVGLYSVKVAMRAE